MKIYKPCSPFSSHLQERPKHNHKALITYTPTTNFPSSRTKSVFPSNRCTFVAARNEDVTEKYRRIPFSDVVVARKKKAFWGRRWNYWDVTRAVVYSGLHLFSALAPFQFNWAAFWVIFALYMIVGFGITLSYHRNLAHRSFKLPKRLKYLFAFCGTLALQGDPIEWVSNHRYHHQYCDTQCDPHSPTQGFWFSHMAWAFDTDYIVEKCGEHENCLDLVKQPFYRFLQRTHLLNNVLLGVLLYLWGGLPFLVWGMVE